ncbi:tumor protein p53-inducible protein 11 isoform X1 [Zalophus californianus]|uniref:Tumor protein p53-inducible protein 11 n=1 Tax=Zalophus californianus TaxID=9704 RepID=A0A6J2BU70_ZALCA|nr:tumor protein p53-inducible protein 11 isoform X1 [Zalophus californianus]XP_027435412.1 tumor protein p53-inducible protein 11 isoform X1 [Zalophus californianus]XP_027435413.1 tumor protein p53-inducible protein 11 isoform X1 [Zalophus californianus]XP_027435414.1 tumor protein p53-inducible protein 11 isoform X1 [Zalophus californianus]XP_027435415.1 tumor protein p53-inducible protein 11 isoform X1 [Zalophus californianus]
MAAKQPPPLMKKHSQTDLVSRLKTRKILGVGGEDDDGEVHRSKISQVLGNEIKFAVREPLGLRVWQFASAVLFSGIAIMALAFPDQLYDAVFDGAQVTSKTPIRLYGGALLSISLIMWNALYTAEKVIIRWTLLTEACYFGVQFLDQAQPSPSPRGEKPFLAPPHRSALQRCLPSSCCTIPPGPQITNRSTEAVRACMLHFRCPPAKVSVQGCLMNQ